MKKTLLLLLILSACTSNSADTADIYMALGNCQQAENLYHQAALQLNITNLQRSLYYESAAKAANCAGDKAGGERYVSLAKVYRE